MLRALLLCVCITVCPTQRPPLVPAHRGINVHFVSNDKPGEIEQVAQAASIVRIDLIWDATERVPGQYTWAPYDQLMRRLGMHGLQPLLTIDYSNIGAFPACNTSAPRSNGHDHVGPASTACIGTNEASNLAHRSTLPP
jgi:hypothetical protein